MKRWGIIEVPSTFQHRDAKWIPIKMEKEFKSFIKEGWYRKRAANLRPLDIGDGVLFVPNDSEVEEWGNIFEKLNEEKMVGVIPYCRARFKAYREKINYTKWVHRSLVKIFSSEEETKEYARCSKIRNLKISKSAQKDLRERKVWIGVTKEMALLSWGRPDDINKTITTHIVREQWVYQRSHYKSDYLYFDDGILSGIQTH